MSCIGFKTPAAVNVFLWPKIHTPLVCGVGVRLGDPSLTCYENNNTLHPETMFCFFKKWVPITFMCESLSIPSSLTISFPECYTKTS